MCFTVLLQQKNFNLVGQRPCAPLFISKLKMPLNIFLIKILNLSSHKIYIQCSQGSYFRENSLNFQNIPLIWNRFSKYITSLKQICSTITVMSSHTKKRTKIILCASLKDYYDAWGLVLVCLLICSDNMIILEEESHVKKRECTCSLPIMIMFLNCSMSSTSHQVI